MWLIVCSNDHASLTVRPIYSSSKLRSAQMMIFSLVPMIGLEKMLHNICISAVAMSLRWASRGPWASCLNFPSTFLVFQHCIVFIPYIQRNVYTFSEGNSVKFVYSSLLKKVYSKKKEFAPLRSKVFRSENSPLFRKDLMCKKANRKS